MESHKKVFVSLLLLSDISKRRSLARVVTGSRSCTHNLLRHRKEGDGREDSLGVMEGETAGVVMVVVFVVEMR